MQFKRYCSAILAALLCMTAYAQHTRTLSGTVFDEFGEPMIGAAVTEPGTSNGSITDLDGNFTLRISEGTKAVEVSFIGYLTQTVLVPSSGKITVTMAPDRQMLQETVVIGYGVQRKSDLTGSVSNISSEDFNEGVINSPEQLINGKVSGVQIVSGGGSPSSGSTIRIRGGASLNASNDPLIVLDGVPMEVGGGVSGAGNFLSLINPNDIENMTILKDASSTAIYGSRASNGVIIITTKKGTQDNRPKVTFSTTNSLQTPTSFPAMINRDQMYSLVSAKGTDLQKGLLQSGRGRRLEQGNIHKRLWNGQQHGRFQKDWRASVPCVPWLQQPGRYP